MSTRVSASTSHVHLHHKCRIPGGSANLWATALQFSWAAWNCGSGYAGMRGRYTEWPVMWSWLQLWLWRWLLHVSLRAGRVWGCTTYMPKEGLRSAPWRNFFLVFLRCTPSWPVLSKLLQAWIHGSCHSVTMWEWNFERTSTGLHRFTVFPGRHCHRNRSGYKRLLGEAHFRKLHAEMPAWIHTSWSAKLDVSI